MRSMGEPLGVVRNLIYRVCTGVKTKSPPV